MQNKILIICFDTPYPTNYGGVIDIVRKFEYFKSKNIKIDLVCTCFDEERKQFLEDFIKQNETIIDNYHIELIKVSPLKALKLFKVKPFSVEVRSIDFSKIDFIQTANYKVVLVEHMKTTKSIKQLISIFDKRNSHPEFWLRLHNDEMAYYKNMYKASKGLKTIFFLTESWKYKFYESRILNSNLFKGFLYISEKDKLNFQSITHVDTNHRFLPIYQTASDSVQISEKPIDFFYIGNLDLDDNLKALKKINSFLEEHNLWIFKIIIAGKCSSIKRENSVKNSFYNSDKITFRFNISPIELQKLYQNAKFFLNFSENESGVKTKLIEALENKIPVISDFEGADGSGYENEILKADEIETKYLFDLLNSNNSYSIYLNKFTDRIKNKEKLVVNYYDDWLKFN
ncbi:MAG: hypothetical protein KIG88_06480 [Weeksellaceae bacterium]|nr:hypothetical protein [Weeksellaceae bacterium]